MILLYGQQYITHVVVDFQLILKSHLFPIVLRDGRYLYIKQNSHNIIFCILSANAIIIYNISGIFENKLKDIRSFIILR